jgi:uncharacterized protein (DUF488 family)
VEIMQGGGVRAVADIRSVPRSRTNPQYNFDVLAAELEPWQIGYGRIPDLGGLRGRSRDVPPEINGYWENRSFHNYADYALSDAFGEALDQLVADAIEVPTAMMCAEAVWWRCHRRIVADYLLLRGIPVFHLMGGGRIEPATMTPAAKEQDRRLVYPAPRN